MRNKSNWKFKEKYMYDFSGNFCTNSKSTFKLPFRLSLSLSHALYQPHSLSFLPFQFIWRTWTRANIVLLFIFDARIARAVCECVHTVHACSFVFFSSLLSLSFTRYRCFVFSWFRWPFFRSLSISLVRVVFHFKWFFLNTVRLNLVDEVALYNFLRCMVWGA